MQNSRPGSLTTVAAVLCAGLAAGAEVSVSPVMGKGFPVDKIPAESNQTVLLFATGACNMLGCL